MIIFMQVVNSTLNRTEIPVHTCSCMHVITAKLSGKYDGIYLLSASLVEVDARVLNVLHECVCHETRQG